MLLFFKHFKLSSFFPLLFIVFFYGIIPLVLVIHMARATVKNDRDELLENLYIFIVLILAVPFVLFIHFIPIVFSYFS